MSENNKKVSLIRTSQPDYWVIVSVLFLLGIGIVMVFSSSTVSSYLQAGSDSYSLLKSQLVYVIAGLIIMVIASVFSYKIYERLSIIAFVFCCGLLALVPFIGLEINGAKRWLGIGSYTFQPSEFVKFGVILFLSYMLANENMTKFIHKWWGMFVYGLPLVGIVLLLFKQPHMSCIIIIAIVCFVIMLVGGVKTRVFLIAFAFCSAIMVVAYFFSEHVRTRINAFFNIGGTSSTNSQTLYQAKQSLYAIGSGGLTGRGAGQSVQKYQYLPEAYNDYIFSILAEELGFIGVLVVLVLFGILIWRGYMIATYAPDKYSCLVATGITTHIASQTLLNIAVATNLIPVTGVALPFFSYGGTSLVIIMAEMGLLLQISKKSAYGKF